MMRNRITPEGQELGRIMAKWCDDAEPKAKERFPQLPERCQSCAFRAGNHLANGSPETQMTALKCVMEGEDFYCHDRNRIHVDQLCTGWIILTLTKETPNIACPWEFVDGAGVEPRNAK